ncbi:cobalamin biosynthesis protein [Nocardioides lijunqiniae]|uniref:cobalamin biosynthesis protein n=1 Tax=Nocardioides lijunqiniae TaxID=2760832 RepID=UPI0018785914|nr:cobalamin biosynthesis protein [Nocardioides lijunqiniae]
MTSGGLVLGYVADAALGDPRRGHPVAGFGRLAGALERRTYADRRAPGVLHVALLVGGAAALGRVAGRGTLVTAAATWAVLGGRSLDREAAAVQALLEAGRLPDARQRLTHLVGRDTTDLDEAGVARAVVESLAENSSDAVVAPLVWGALAGTPGLLAHRAANTLDAMVGHRSPRYERFGWAAARFDDLLNLPGSRLTAALTVLLGDDHGGAVRAWRRDAGAHPSPNAGPVEAAFAGALGVRLGGRTVYAGRVEERPVLGDGREVGVHDVTRARRLARRVDLAALLVCAAASAASAALRRRR